MRSTGRESRRGSLRDIHRTLHGIVIGTVALWILVCVLAVGAVIGGKIEVQRIGEVAKQATRALCIQRANYDRSIRDTKAFLKTHPNGIPGLSRQVFLRSLRLTEQARAALSDIHCN